MQSIVAAKPTKQKQYLKFICFRKTEQHIDYETRYLFSLYCDIWFLDKTKPTTNLLRQRSGFRPETIKQAIANLINLALIDDSEGRRKGQPILNDTILYKKEKFDAKFWWKGVQCRIVRQVAKPKEIARQNTVTAQRFKSVKADVAFAFIEYKNRKKARIGPAYVAAVTGLSRMTCQRLLADMLDAGLVKRTDTGLIAVLRDDQKTFTAAENMKAMVARELVGHPWDEDTYSQIVAAGVKNYEKLKREVESARRQATGKVDFHRLSFNLGVRPRV
jgi:hypothetical protein